MATYNVSFAKAHYVAMRVEAETAEQAATVARCAVPADYEICSVLTPDGMAPLSVVGRCLVCARWVLLEEETHVDILLDVRGPICEECTPGVRAESGM